MDRLPTAEDALLLQPQDAILLRSNKSSKTNSKTLEQSIAQSNLTSQACRGRMFINIIFRKTRYLVACTVAITQKSDPPLTTWCLLDHNTSSSLKIDKKVWTQKHDCGPLYFKERERCSPQEPACHLPRQCLSLSPPHHVFSRPW